MTAAKASSMSTSPSLARLFEFLVLSHHFLPEEMRYMMEDTYNNTMFVRNLSSSLLTLKVLFPWKNGGCIETSQACACLLVVALTTFDSYALFVLQVLSSVFLLSRTLMATTRLEWIRGTVLRNKRRFWVTNGKNKAGMNMDKESLVRFQGTDARTSWNISDDLMSWLVESLFFSISFFK